MSRLRKLLRDQRKHQQHQQHAADSPAGAPFSCRPGFSCIRELADGRQHYLLATRTSRKHMLDIVALVKGRQGVHVAVGESPVGGFLLMVAMAKSQHRLADLGKLVDADPWTEERLAAMPADQEQDIAVVGWRGWMPEDYKTLMEEVRAALWGKQP